jgi:S1-C subfamily serine protease
MIKNIIIIIGIFVTGIVGGIFSEQILWPYFVDKPLFYEYGLEKRPIYINEEKIFYIQENIALREAIKKIDNVVVGTRAKINGKVVNGSGIIITSDGLILTVSEVIPQGSDITLISKKGNLVASVIKRKDGLVMLKAEGSNWPTVNFINKNDIMLGQRVFFLSAFLDGLELRNMVGEGIVSYLTENKIKTDIYDEDILAGSPLFNIEGGLVGMKGIDQEGPFIIPISDIGEFSGF